MKPYKRTEAPDSPYYVQFTVDGIKHQFCTGCLDRDAALAAGLAEKAKIKAGHKDTTIRHVWEVYEANSFHLKLRTRTQAKNSLIALLKHSDLTMDSPVTVLNRQVITTYQRKMVGHEQSANSLVLYARSIFSRRILPHCEHLKLPDLSGFLRQPLMRVFRRQYQPPPQSSIDRMLEDARAFKETDKPAYAAFLLEFYMGLRASDTLRAEWSWICEIRGKDGSNQWALHVQAESTKNRRDRFIPIADRVHAELMALRQPPATGMHDYIVWGRSGRQRRDTIYRRLSDFIKGRLGRRQTNHELRKYCGAVFATEQGLYAAQVVLGHSTPVLTSQIYAALINLPKPIQPAGEALVSA